MELTNLANKFILEFWKILYSSSSPILLGLIIASLLKSFLPVNAIGKLLRKNNFISILKSSAIGVPLPLCSCSVIPVAVEFRRQGASKAATASFLVSTPEIGVDSFLLSYRLIGGAFALVRTISAFISAMIVGLLVKIVDKEVTEATELPIEQLATESLEKKCCHADKSRFSIRKIFTYALVTLIDDISVALLIGFTISSLVSTVIPEEMFNNLGLSAFSEMLLMLVFSIPVYICASASTPIAATLMAKGLSPSAALVMLLAGPATNSATIAVAYKELGLRSTLCYIGGIIFSSLACGFIFSSSIEGLKNLELGLHSHQNVFEQVLYYIFIVVFALSLFRKVKKQYLKKAHHKS